MMDREKGLTQKEVAEKIALGQVNHMDTKLTKSYGEIIRDNICTLFNLVNVVLALLVAWTKSYQNLLFMGVVLCNIAIGILQEIRSKRQLDKIAVLVAPKAQVYRDGRLQEIQAEELVVDDVIHLKNGQQIPADGIMLEGVVEVNESLLSGESDAIPKHAQDILYGGSFISSGSCDMRITKVGKETFVNQLSIQAKAMHRHPSQLHEALNTILKGVSMLILPIGILMFIKQYVILHATLDDAILQTAASMIGMIPEGLFFLTSISLAVGVMNLLRHKTLVQELACIESLARVDTLCLDKTGTITEGIMQLVDIIPLEHLNIEEIIGNLVRVLDDENATIQAIRNTIQTQETMSLCHVIPFSSERKYSGAKFVEHTYLLGAYEYMDVVKDKHVENILQQHIEKGERVLCLAQDDEAGKYHVIAFLCLKDQVRKDAKEIFTYFKAQGVMIKVISGDQAESVSLIAQQAKIPHAQNYMDASTLKEDQIADAVRTYSVFGRVSPAQKQQMIMALKAQGHTVAMSGDGVNDVLAFKAADCSIAMASGSEAARHSANMVLLNNDFCSLPKVLFEGRRVINNIERVSSLFLTKTLYSLMLAVLILVTGIEYPFMPIHLSFISVFTIGIPSFFLALEPNKERVQGDFIKNVLSASFPGACAVIISIMVGMSMMQLFEIQNSLDTYCLFCVSVNGMLLLYRVAKPFTRLKKVIFFVSLTGLIIGYLGFYEILLIQLGSISHMLFMLLFIFILQVTIMQLVSTMMKYYQQQRITLPLWLKKAMHMFL